MDCIKTRVCRLCTAEVDARTTVHLFNTSGYKNQWASRISTLLDVPVDKTDSISPYVCKMCTSRLVSLEKAAADLLVFRDMAQCSLAALQRTKQRPFKRTKETSGAVGMSPDTAKQRSSSKVARKKLLFTCKLSKCIIVNILRSQ